MSGVAREGWVVASSIGAVEALKDQLGICRWNYSLRCMLKHAKTSVQSYSNTHLLPAAPNSFSSAKTDQSCMDGKKKIEGTEKCLKKVMDLNCWGPTTVRF